MLMYPDNIQKSPLLCAGYENLTRSYRNQYAKNIFLTESF